MADREPTPTLTFETLHEGAPVSIDGQRYEIRHPFALSLGTFERVRRLWMRVSVLIRQDPLSQEDELSLASWLREICTAVLDAPDEVQAKLGDGQRVLICEAFIKLRA